MKRWLIVSEKEIHDVSAMEDNSELKQQLQHANETIAELREQQKPSTQAQS